MRWRFCLAILTHSASKIFKCNIRLRVIDNLNWSNHNVCHLIQETVSGQPYVHSDICNVYTADVCLQLFYFWVFFLYIYPPDSQES